MTCPKCNTDVAIESKFCPNCGLSLNKPDVPAPAPPASIAPLWAYVAAVVAVTLVIYVVYGWTHASNSVPSEAALRTAVPFAPNNTGWCVRPYGTAGQYGSGVLNWQPRNDGRCYLEDEPPQPQPHLVFITNGALTVNARGYSSYPFTLPAGATNPGVVGHFSATGGSRNDVIAFIVDEDGLANLQNRHPVRTYYNSGQVTQAEIQTVLPASRPGTYYLIFDNRMSVISPKAIQVNATLRYMQ